MSEGRSEIQPPVHVGARSSDGRTCAEGCPHLAGDQEVPMTEPRSEYRHVGSFAPHGHDGMGWLGNTDIYVKAEDYDNHVNYSADAFAVYAENAHLRAELDRLASFIAENVEGEPSQSEGAVDCAIRLLRGAYIGRNDPS